MRRGDGVGGGVGTTTEGEGGVTTGCCLKLSIFHSFPKAD